MSESACVGAVPDCPQCARGRDGHAGQPCDDLCRSIAELVSTPAGHANWHAVQACPGCGSHGDRLMTQPCPSRRCVTWLCPHCGHNRGEDLSLACPACHGRHARLQWWLITTAFKPLDWWANRKTRRQAKRWRRVRGESHR